MLIQRRILDPDATTNDFGVLGLLIMNGITNKASGRFAF
jgi:hypothetical protein